MLVEAIVIVVNGLLWLLLFLYLKKKLSPEGLLNEAKKELQDLLLQINSSTDRNIRLVQEQKVLIKKTISEAEELREKIEERLTMLYGELEKTEAVKTVEERVYQDSSSMHVEKNIVNIPDFKNTAEISSSVDDFTVHTIQSNENEGNENPLPVTDTLNKSYTPLGSYMKEQLRFSPADLPDETVKEMPVEQSSENIKKIEIPEFIKASEPIQIKKSFKQQVMEMRSLGYSIEEIAHETGRSTQEVKITIEIS